ncbi:hypothetical protein A2U01_0079942, partial [Trifolium medium]|nr:hypothetical protein [Trifolium medium]
ARSAKPGEYWRATAEHFHPPGENQRESRYQPLGLAQRQLKNIHVRLCSL